eukprot:gene13715-18397_t
MSSIAKKLLRRQNEKPVEPDMFLTISQGDIIALIKWLDSLEKQKSSNDDATNHSKVTALINKPRWSGFTLLHRAASCGQTDMCEILLRRGAQVNLRTSLGWYTPLHVALSNGYTDTAQFLIENGANPWVKSKHNEDPFEYGINNGYRKITIEFRSKIARIEMVERVKRQQLQLKTMSKDKINKMIPTISSINSKNSSSSDANVDEIQNETT